MAPDAEVFSDGLGCFRRVIDLDVCGKVVSEFLNVWKVIRVLRFRECGVGFIWRLIHRSSIEDGFTGKKSIVVHIVQSVAGLHGDMRQDGEIVVDIETLEGPSSQTTEESIVGRAICQLWRGAHRD